MTKQVVSVPWGADTLQISIPNNWSLLGKMEPSPLVGVIDPAYEASQSLQSPIGCQRLSELVKPGLKIALVIDDGSRPTPVHQILPIVLEEIRRGGVDLDQITLIPALGVHRKMEAGEVQQRAGGALSGLKWENPDCDDPLKQVNLGTTSRGTPVLVNKIVAEADVIVSIGCIEPHIIASFGGGYKNLFPGVAGRETIAHNHGLNCQPGTFNMVGQPIEKNPMRQDLEEAGKMLKGKTFIINAVLNSSMQIVKIVCGDPIEAHRAGTKISAQIYGVKIPRAADVVITASHPMDQDLRQGVKALANTVRAVRKGGTMITLIRAEEGVGVFGLANKKLPVGRNGLRLLAPLLLPNISKLKLKGMGEEDKFFLYFALQAMRHAELLLYAPTIPAEIHPRLPFVTFMETAQLAVDRAARHFPNGAKFLYFPYGGSTYPILPD